MKLDKFDIEILDFIIDSILETDSQIYDGILNKFDKLKDYKPSELKLESDRIMSILELYDCAKINRYIKGNAIIKNAHTKKFKEHGGFAKIYQDELTRQEKVEQKEKLELDLAKSNLEANELNKSIAAKNDKNNKKNILGMWVNISIGALNIVLIAIQIWLSSQ